MNNLNLKLAGVCVLTLCALTLSVSPSDAQTPCTGSPAVEWLPHPTRCSHFYVCLGAQHFLRSCRPNTSWQPEKRACVHTGSADDTCNKHMTVTVSPDDPQSPCTGSPKMEWLPHPTNCNQFYVCLGAQNFLRSCKPNTLWQPEKRACVHKGSPDDICPCENRQSGGVFRHPTNCAQYYNCSAEAIHAYPDYLNRGGDYLDECHFPQLFSMLTGKCENYTQVDCGRRFEAKNPCDYVRNQCAGPNCVPCGIRHPDCRGLPDGPNAWRGKSESPYYCICQNGRAIREGYCPDGIFHPTQLRCVDGRSYFENKP